MVLPLGMEEIEGQDSACLEMTKASRVKYTLLQWRLRDAA